MEWVDRYVQAVTERLPEDIRTDVGRELLANIEDTLPDNATEEDVRAVLEELGNPAALSNEYRQAKRYLIGPALYDSYISVLKLVAGIAAITFTLLALIGVLSQPANDSSRIIAQIVSAAFEGAGAALFWVTLVFAILERTGLQEGNLPFKKKRWTVDDLPSAAQHPASRISRSEAVADIVINTIFVAVLLGRGEDGLQFVAQLVAPVFDVVRLQAYVPALVILAVAELGMSVFKFISGRWTLPLAVANALNDLGATVVVVLMLSDRTLFNQGLLSFIAGVPTTPAGGLGAWLGRGLLAFMVISVALAAIDSINGFAKSRKQATSGG